MATSQIASMLDELMGRNRNYLPDDANARELKWSDAEVCRYYIVQFCPHDLFTNTKADLGPCSKIHDDELKKKFQEEKESYKKSQYLDEFLRFCQRMLADLQNRIKKAKERLALTQQNEERILQSGGPGLTGGQNVEADEKIILLSEKISALVAEAEQAGIQGNVEQAQGLMKLCDQLRDERDTLRRAVIPSISSIKDDYNAQQKAMEVCETCGAFLIVGDAQQRIDDHLLGKQHVGYARLRAAIDQIMDERRKFREERDREVERRRHKDDLQHQDQDRSRKRKEMDDNNRERRKDRRNRSRSRDRRDHRRSRSRELERDRRPNAVGRDRSNRSRPRRSRSRSRNRDTERRDRRRSRSKERREKNNRKRSSRSKSPKRSRSGSASRNDDKAKGRD